MTSDAKIGLLLGLVFIFIIAFIINGLPRLRGETGSNELTEIMMKNNSPGIGGWERKADEVLNPPPQTADQAVQPQQPSDNSAQTLSDNSDIRYSVPIPGYGSLVKDSFSQQESQTAIGPVRPAEDNLLAPLPGGIDRPRTVQTIEPTTTMTIRPVQLPKNAETKTHVVAADETLASIAKKYYGPEEGNRRINVTKIFEANSELLKSPDEIKVGQKLVIPAAPVKAKSLFPSSSFEQVKSIGQKLTFSDPPKTTPGRLYTVKEGDSLWTISAEKLGNGIRYKEIAKLNADVLPSEDDLRVGISLKMPAK